MTSKPRPTAPYDPRHEIYEDKAAIEAARARIAVRDKACRAVRLLGLALESGHELAIVAARKAFDGIARWSYGVPVESGGSPAAAALLEHQLFEAMEQAIQLIPVWGAVTPDGEVYVDHARGMLLDNFPSRGAVERFLDATKGRYDVALKPAQLPDRRLHPGQTRWADRPGYLAIGSGGMHASISLAMTQHSPLATLSQCLFNVYRAKRSAETAPGVGDATDMVVVNATGPRTLSQAALDELSRLYLASRPSSSTEFATLEGLL